MQYKKEEKRERILDSARKEFFKYGKENSSIRRIAERAKVAVGNVYNYFSSKDEIFEILVEPIGEKVSKFIDKIISYKVDRDSFQEVISSATPYIVNNKHEIMMIMNMTDKSGVKNKDKYFKIISDKLKEEMDEFSQGRGREPVSTAYARGLSKAFLYGLFEILLFSKDEQFATENVNRYMLFFFENFSERI